MAIGKKKGPLQDQTKSFSKFQQALKPIDKKAQKSLPKKKGK